MLVRLFLNKLLWSWIHASIHAEPSEAFALATQLLFVVAQTLLHGVFVMSGVHSLKLSDPSLHKGKALQEISVKPLIGAILWQALALAFLALHPIDAGHCRVSGADIRMA